MSASSGTIPRPPLDIDSEDTTTKKATTEGAPPPTSTTEMKASPGHRSLFSRVSTFGSDLVNALGDGINQCVEFILFIHHRGSSSFTSRLRRRGLLSKKQKQNSTRARAERVSLSISLFLSFENHQSRLRIAGRILRRRRRIREKKDSTVSRVFHFFLQNTDTKKTQKN